MPRRPSNAQEALVVYMAAFANKIKEEALSHKLLCATLSYDPETGTFIRKVGSVRAPVGSVAGNVMKNGYRIIRVNYSKFLAGRLAWFYVHKTWPSDEIDHINRVRDDNRIANLRPATRSQNAVNSVHEVKSCIGIRNIDLNKGRFRLRIERDGKVFQKKFRLLEDAIIAREAQLKAISPEYAGGCN